MTPPEPAKIESACVVDIGRGICKEVLPTVFQRSHQAAGKLLAGLRVLVCEDDADSRELFDVVLSAEGATVLAAASASEAMDHLREFRPDVLVSDIGLPGVDGYALMRQIRELASDEGGRIPAIALTAYAGMEDARKAFSAGYQLHVAKPVDPADLTVTVANLARQHASGGSGDPTEWRPR